MRLDMKMKSAVHRNLGGARSGRRATARDTAGASMPVERVVDTVVDPTEPQHDNAPRTDDDEGRRADARRRRRRFSDRNARRQLIRLAASVMTATTKRAAKVRGMTRQAGSSRAPIGHRSTVPMIRRAAMAPRSIGRCAHATP